MSQIPDFAGLYDSLYGLAVAVPWAGEFLAVLIGGGMTGFVAMLVYMFQRHMERKEITWNNADIMLGEIDGVLGAKMAGDPTRIEHIDDLPPCDDIYRGLLSSGNIRYFHNDLRHNLDVFYRGVKSGAKDRIDAKLGIEIMSQLEILQGRHEPYRNKLTGRRKK